MTPSSKNNSLQQNMVQNNMVLVYNLMQFLHRHEIIVCSLCTCMFCGVGVGGNLPVYFLGGVMRIDDVPVY